MPSSEACAARFSGDAAGSLFCGSRGFLDADFARFEVDVVAIAGRDDRAGNDLAIVKQQHARPRLDRQVVADRSHGAQDQGARADCRKQGSIHGRERVGKPRATVKAAGPFRRHARRGARGLETQAIARGIGRSAHSAARIFSL
jgi:hypothetical protein